MISGRVEVEAMRQRNPRLPKECIYCRAVVARKPKEGEKKLSREHVPPQGLFPSAFKHNLLTVPCCVDCNGEKSQNDEFLRDVLVVVAEGKTPSANAIFERGTLASWKKHPTKRREWADRLEFYQSSFIFHPPVPRLNIEGDRVRRAISDIAKGFVFAHHGVLLEPGFHFDVSPVDGHFIDELMSQTPSVPYHIGDAAIFRVQSLLLEAGDFLVHLNFYGGVHWIAMSPNARRIIFPESEPGTGVSIRLERFRDGR